MKRLIHSTVNESFKPKGLVVPDKCMINTFIFKYNSALLEQMLLAEVLCTVVIEDENETHWILVTLSKTQYDVLLKSKMGPIFNSLSW